MSDTAKLVALTLFVLSYPVKLIVTGDTAPLLPYLTALGLAIAFGLALGLIRALRTR